MNKIVLLPTILISIILSTLWVPIAYGFDGPLRVSQTNRNYFTDNTGKAILVTGAHSWRNFQAIGSDNFDYNAYLNFLTQNNLNFMRLWIWEESRGPEGYPESAAVNPLPFVKNTKYDLSQLNQAFFDRMRQHVIDAGSKNIYVSIQLFNGWSVGSKNGGSSPWPEHPMNINNNSNGINGDTNGDGNGYEVHTLGNSTITAFQDAYVKKVIDTVNDLDNVLFEICNEAEGDPATVAWQNHMIDLIHSYEKSKPKQHVVGFTALYSNGSSRDLINSNADWIAPGDAEGYQTNPPANTGNKVIIADTDHLWGLGGDRNWVWKSFTRGLNFSYMDCYVEDSIGCPISQNDPIRVSLIKNMGYAREYATKLDLVSMTPQNSLSSTGYTLAKTGSEYLVYQPAGGQFTVNLSAGKYSSEWLNPSTGAKTNGSQISGGSPVSFTPPFSADAVLYLKAQGLSPTPTTPLPTTTPSGCIKKSSGDADCNGAIDLIDFEIFRKEYTGSLSTKTADFDNNGSVSISDFEIWRKGHF